MIQVYRQQVSASYINEVLKGDFVYGDDGAGIVGFVYDIHLAEGDVEVWLFNPTSASALPSNIEVIKHSTPHDEMVAELAEVIKAAPQFVKDRWRDVIQLILS